MKLRNSGPVVEVGGSVERRSFAAGLLGLGFQLGGEWGGQRFVQSEQELDPFAVPDYTK